MARNKWGPLGPFIGKIGPLIGYLRRGTPVIRAQPHKSNKPRSNAQKASNKAFSLVMKFAPPINDLISYGFHPATKGLGAIPQNAFTGYLRKNAIAGEYPDLYIDCSKVLVSMGDIIPPAYPTVTLNNGKLTFSWDVDPNWPKRNNTDQVLVLAYYTATKRAAYAIGNNWKYEGQAVLELLPAEKDYLGKPLDTVVETYLAFISNNRQRVSDSVYTGQIVL